MINIAISKEHHEKAINTAKKKRAKLLDMLPESFTSKEASAVWGLTSQQTSNMLQDMKNKCEVHKKNDYSIPVIWVKGKQNG